MNGAAVRFVSRCTETQRIYCDIGVWYIVVSKIAAIEGRDAWDRPHTLSADGKAR